MIASWYTLFLDPERRLRLAGGGGEVPVWLVVPIVKRERMANEGLGGHRHMKADFLQPHT